MGSIRAFEAAIPVLQASNQIVMKYLLILLLLVAFAGAQTTDAPNSSQTAAVDQENSRKAKLLLDQAIQALGGPAYLNIQDMTQEGRGYSFYHGRPNSVGVISWRYYKYPDKDRTEFTKKRDVILINNGNKGYEITYKGTRAQDPKDLTDFLRRRHYALDVVLRKWINEPGVALFYEGQTATEGKAVDQVSVMNAHNEGVTLYLDTATHLPVKKSFTWRDPTDKQRNQEEEVYDNYREAQGVMTPFTITRFFNGDMSSQRFLTTVSYNQGLSDSKFEASITAEANKR
jgi:hypothetical protein